MRRRRPCGWSGRAPEFARLGRVSPSSLGRSPAPVLMVGEVGMAGRGVSCVLVGGMRQACAAGLAGRSALPDQC
jgi:hypothetical protein